MRNEVICVHPPMFKHQRQMYGALPGTMNTSTTAELLFRSLVERLTGGVVLDLLEDALPAQLVDLADVEVLVGFGIALESATAESSAARHLGGGRCGLLALAVCDVLALVGGHSAAGALAPGGYRGLATIAEHVGGLACLRSHGLTDVKAIPSAHINADKLRAHGLALPPAVICLAILRRKDASREVGEILAYRHTERVSCWIVAIELLTLRMCWTYLEGPHCFMYGCITRTNRHLL